MKPCNARTDAAILKLRRDNFPAEPDQWSLLVNEDHVSLHAPASEGSYFIRIPHEQFANIARWYLRDQQPLVMAARK